MSAIDSVYDSSYQDLYSQEIFEDCEENLFEVSRFLDDSSWKCTEDDRKYFLDANGPLPPTPPRIDLNYFVKNTNPYLQIKCIHP